MIRRSERGFHFSREDQRVVHVDFTRPYTQPVRAALYFPLLGAFRELS